MTVTDRDHRLFRLLTTQVRLATDDQLAQAADADGRLDNRLRALVDRGLLSRALVTVARPQVDQPLCTVRPGDAAPDGDGIAWKLEQRWRTAATHEVSAYWATARCAHLFGGIGGGLRQPFQIAHDLLVTDVFLRRLERDPATRTQWVGEDLFRLQSDGDTSGKIPDAVLIDGQGQVTWAVEAGGVYPAKRLKALHEFCQRRSWSYEIW